MAKIHVNGDGESSPCNAKKGKCPFGAERHFDNEQDAQAFAAQEAEAKYSENSSVSKKSSQDKKADSKDVDFGNYAEGSLYEAKTGVPEYDNLSDDEKIEMDNAIAYLNSRDYATQTARRAMVVGSLYDDNHNVQYGLINETNDPELTQLVRRQIRQGEDMQDATRSVVAATRGAFVTSEESDDAAVSQQYNALSRMGSESSRVLRGRYRMDWDSEVNQLKNNINHFEDAERNFNANADALEPHRKRFEKNRDEAESFVEKRRWEIHARATKEAQDGYRKNASSAKALARQYKNRLDAAQKTADGIKHKKGFDQFGTRINSVNSQHRTGRPSSVAPLSMSSAKDKEETAKKLSAWRDAQKNAATDSGDDLSGFLTEVSARTEVDTRVSNMVRNDGYVVTRQGSSINDNYVTYVESRMAMEKASPDSAEYKEHKKNFDRARTWVEEEDARVRIGLTYSEVDKHNSLDLSEY